MISEIILTIQRTFKFLKNIFEDTNGTLKVSIKNN